MPLKRGAAGHIPKCAALSTQPQRPLADQGAMRTRYDQLGKQILDAVLHELGKVTRQLEVSPEVQHVDLFFEPGQAPEASLAELGALRNVVAEPCLIEVFREAPSLHEVRACQHKQLSLHLARGASSNPPRLWFICGGRPSTAMSAFGFRTMTGLMRGFFAASPGLQLGLIVTSMLPRRRSTLVLRLLGAGRTFDKALEDLMALEAHAAERQRLLPVLVRLRFEVEQMDRQQRTPEEERLMKAHEAFEAFERQAIEKGIEKGAVRVLTRQLERRFGTLSDDLRMRLEQANPSQLDAWAEQLLDASSLDEVFAVR